MAQRHVHTHSFRIDSWEASVYQDAKLKEKAAKERII